MNKWAPLALVGFFALWILGTLAPKHDPKDGYAFHTFGSLPIVANGRTQPLDSLARNSLLELCQKQKVETKPWEPRQFWESAPEIKALPWLAEMFFHPELADTRPVFLIDHPDLKGFLGLPLKEDASQETDGRRYNWTHLRGKLHEMQTEAQRIRPKKEPERNAYERAVMQLWERMLLYMRLQNTVQPQNAGNWLAEWQSYRSHLEAGVAAVRAQQAGKTFDNGALETTMHDLQRFDTMDQLEGPLPVPPAPVAADDTAKPDWTRMGAALMGVAHGEVPSPAIEAYARMSSAYRQGQVQEFNRAAGEYRAVLTGSAEPVLRKVGHEQYFSEFNPFVNAMAIYLVAALCAFVFWFAPDRLEWLRRAAAGLVLLALAVHTTGLIFRMVLEGRPPVTNLYSSAIFIGWGACILGLVLERFWRNSIGLVVSASIGFVTLIIAHHLSLGGDTMEMMRAVLDTNLWLATHVVVVTLGYASTFVAGTLAIIYILRDAVGGGLEKATAQALAKMVYGILCFATLFSFVGTVLGGIWADQSWGRFWGWDPKENGALIIVLWNALILHARWGGLVRERGLMALAIFGNIVTAWSWFGVNMLGIGLHSYGFTDAAFYWLIGFAGSQLFLIVLTLLQPLLRRRPAPPISVPPLPV